MGFPVFQTEMQMYVDDEFGYLHFSHQSQFQFSL